VRLPRKTIFLWEGKFARSRLYHPKIRTVTRSEDKSCTLNCLAGVLFGMLVVVTL
jgi:hypothetical protein